MNSCRENKLRKLKENTPTIFAPNCWGGLTYHHLGLEFCSPLINMWETHEDYLRLLSDPEYYMSQELRFKETYNGGLCAPYPIVMLGDVLIRMNHYKDFKEAAECWERRKRRIKWDNLIVMLWDEDIDIIRRFMSLPYKRKICFAPFETGIDGVIPVLYREHESLRSKEFWEIMNNLAQFKYILYDDLSLIHDGSYIKIGNFDYDPNYRKGDTKRDTEK